MTPEILRRVAFAINNAGTNQVLPPFPWDDLGSGGRAFRMRQAEYAVMAYLSAPLPPVLVRLVPKVDYSELLTKINGTLKTMNQPKLTLAQEMAIAGTLSIYLEGKP